MLIESTSPAVLDEVRGTESYGKLVEAVRAVSDDVHIMDADWYRVGAMPILHNLA